MSVLVTRHPKGILLQGTEVGTARLSTTKLRRLLDVPISPTSNHGYVIPLQYAYIVLRSFGPNEATWDEELLQFADTQASKHDAQLQARIDVQDAIQNAHSIMADYPLVNVLDAHQIEAVAAISVLTLQGIAIFDEQGTGKTIMALCGYDRLCQQHIIDKLLVIAPKSVLGSWETDAKKLFGSKYDYHLVTGSTRERRHILMSPYDILAISYETAFKEQALLKLILSSKSSRYLLVVDEAYFVKNPDAQRTRIVTELRNYCSRAVILCGTPAPNSPHDIIQQINIADGGVTFGRVDVPEDEDLARSVIEEALQSAVYLRRLKHEVFPDIPHKKFERVTFELRPIQHRLYEAAKAQLITDIEDVDEKQFAKQLTSFLARRAALLQICSHPRSIDDTYTETPAKHLVLDGLLRDLIARQGKKVVIWSYYRFSLEALAKRFSHYGLVRIDGSVVDIAERIEAIRKFQYEPHTMIFLGNAAAAGAGITLTAAHHAIYESFSNQAAHYMQSIDRIHRRGQSQDVTYHVLLAKDTLEEQEFDRILQKEQSSRNLLGDRYEEPYTRERFLSELGRA